MINKNTFEMISPMMNHAYMMKSWFVEKLMPVEKKYNLKQTELSILIVLHLNPEIQTARDIENFCELKRGNISICVEKLFMRGLLEQQSVEGDRRLKKLVLTEKTSQILEECDNLIEFYINALLEGIDCEDLKKSRKIFDKMVENQAKINKNKNFWEVV